MPSDSGGSGIVGADLQVGPDRPEGLSLHRRLPCLMVVTDRALCGGAEGLPAAVEAAVSGGADAVQLREKDLPAAELMALARRLRAVTQGRALLIVNGPLEVAVAVEADGVHLPEDAPMLPRPRRGFLVGRSVPSAEAARRAEAEGTD